MAQWDVIVVGAGPAGLTAATRAAERGRRTLLLERNRKPGVKILMSGGTRCNLTHATDEQGIVEAFGPQGRFLHSALSSLGPQAVVDLFEAEGVPTKVEPGGKVFPASDRATDVLAALMRRLRRSGAVLVTEESLGQIDRQDAGFVLTTSRQTVTAGKLILTTGGKSYPGCGTTGDGYGWAAALGHTIVPPRAALVPLTTEAAWAKQLTGITMPDVVVRLVLPENAPSPGGRVARRAVLAQRRGSLLFAHFGLSGPAALDVSREVSAHPRGRRPTLLCDFLPEVSVEQLDAMMADASLRAGRRNVGGLLDRWLPHRLAETLVEQVGLAAQRRAAELAREDRVRLVAAVKQLAIPLSGTLGFEKAEATAGGVALEEVDSRSMESRRTPNLFFAGELLDLDGPIGGYNFQAAFSTGMLAGQSV